MSTIDAVKPWSGRKAPVPPRGNNIMEVAEKLRPGLTVMLQGARDADGMLLQPAHIRSIALNMAQGIVKQYYATA